MSALNNTCVFGRADTRVRPYVGFPSGMEGFVLLKGGGLFGRGKSMSTSMGDGFRNGTGFSLMLPNVHGSANDGEAPLGSGIVALVGLGVAYLVGKRRREEL